jgi:hypothetical protein
MKKTITALVACGALLVPATPAQAAPKDPVQALKGKLISGHGVRFTETTTLSGDDKVKLQDRKGTFQFNAKGIAAADMTSNSTGLEPERTIRLGKVSYTSGGLWKDRLPEGKTWLKGGLSAGAGGFQGQVINPAEPKTLATLIKKGRLTRSTITGKITFDELEKVSPWFAASIPLRMHNEKVSYTLTLTSAGLVSGVKSSYAATGVFDKSEFDGKTITIDSRFTGWGTKVSIKAPDPETVTSKMNN